MKTLIFLMFSQSSEKQAKVQYIKHIGVTLWNSSAAVLWSVFSSEKKSPIVSFYPFVPLFYNLDLGCFFVGLAIETHKLQVKEMHQQHENEVNKHYYRLD